MRHLSESSGVPGPLDPAALSRAIEAIDRANEADPRPVPLARLEGELASAWVLQLSPQASSALVLAARAHHLQRWAIPRSDHPEGRAGYLRWRVAVRKVQAQAVASVLSAAGVEDATIGRVQALVRKEGLGSDPDAQILEDSVCLVFLETQAEALAARLDDDRMVNALRKSLGKMSAAGRGAAASVAMGERCRLLLARAVAPG